MGFGMIGKVLDSALACACMEVGFLDVPEGRVVRSASGW